MKSLNKEQLEHNIEIFMGNLLRIGVLSAAVIVLIGGITYLLENGFKIPDYTSFNSEPANLKHVTSIFTEAISFHSRGLIQFGLLLLVIR